MLKKLAALGFTAALAFAPVAGFAQTTTPDTTAPAADAKPMAEKPMHKHHHHHHYHHMMMKHHMHHMMKKKMDAPAEAPKS